MKRIAIYPSILSADFSRLKEQILLVEKAGADGIHLDIMDGHFVPNISFGPVVVCSIRKVTNLPFWAHLMIEEPDKYLEVFKDCGVEGIVVHPETGKDISFLADRIHSLGLKAGVALNPETDLEVIENVLDQFERILIMTVHPGFGGQSFIPGSLKKITALKGMVASLFNPPIIEVDGGIDLKTAPKVVDAGVDALVIGSAIFRADNPASALVAIRNEVGKEVKV